jgi:predicted Zn-dependent protease
VIEGDAVLEQLRGLVERGPHQAEAVYLLTRTGMTRFAASRIHQNLERTEAALTFRVALEGRIGLARTTDLRPAGLESCLARALAIARLQKPNPWFAGLPAGPADLPAAGPGKPIPEPAQRLELAHGLLREVTGAGLLAAGSLSTVHGELLVVNSGGRLARAPYRLAESVLIAMEGEGGNGSSGYAAWAGHDPADLDPRRMAAVASEKCIAGRQAASLDSGPVDVLLEPPAVAGLLDWFSYIGFGGKQYNEGTSFLSGRLGEQITGSAVTIYDDHAEIPGMGLGIDFEGLPRQRVDLIRDGAAAGVVHDSLSGARAGTAGTGHAMSPEVEWGPMPLNLALAPGRSTREEMLASLDRGLLVTRFHYLNGLLDTRRALFTGMTRDGTFLVRQGRIAGAVANLRFTEPMLEAFSRIAAIGSERQSLGTWAGRGATCTVPPVLIRDFHFDNGD